MKEVTVRKERYGTIVFSPTKKFYYTINDKILEKAIFDICKNSLDLCGNLDQKRKTCLKDLGFFDYKARVVDNTRFFSDIFVPLEIYFDYTSRCNKSCEYCYNRKWVGNTTMKPDIVKKVFDDLYDIGIMRVHLAGGEPTIDYEGIKNYITESSLKKGMVVSMATNGTCLDDRMCDLLTTSDLLSVSLSIDSASEEKNDIGRGKGTFNQIVSGAKNLYRYKEKNKSNLDICFKPVYSPGYEDREINDLIDLALELKIDKVKFANPERCLMHSKGHYGSIKKGYYETAHRISKIIENRKHEIALTNITNPAIFKASIGLPFNKGCIGAQELITINPDGRITPCLMNHTLLGNYHDYPSLSDFLKNSEILAKYRKRIVNDECCSCNLYSSCRGGCQVRKIVEHGEIKEKDPLCPQELSVNTQSASKNDALISRINVYHSL